MEIIKEKKTVKIDPELKETIKTLAEEESQVIIHLCLNYSSQGRMRIWKSTFLIPHNKGDKIKLVINSFRKNKVEKTKKEPEALAE